MSDRLVSDNPQPVLRRSPKWEAKFGVVPRERKQRDAATRMRIINELHEFGVGMRAQKFRRDHPDADEATIRRMVRAWLRSAPPHKGSGFIERKRSVSSNRHEK